jgi:hypothetical protein
LSLDKVEEERVSGFVYSNLAFSVLQVIKGKFAVGEMKQPATVIKFHFLRGQTVHISRDRQLVTGATTKVTPISIFGTGKDKKDILPTAFYSMVP